MKPQPLHLFVAVACCLTPPAVFGQSTTTTQPIGLVTVTATGTGGTGGTKTSFKALAVTPEAVWQGKASAVGINTITDSTAAWTDSKFNGSNGPHYVEIISVNFSTTAAGVGTTYSISATSAASKTITLTPNLAAGLTAPIGYRIHKHWTIASVFGATNSAGLQGGNSISADQVVFSNGTGYDTYYYQTSGIGGTGWRKSGAATVDASGDIIYLDECFLVKRGQTANVSFIVAGAVKTGRTTIGIDPGMNFVSNVYSAALTLASSGLYTGSSTTGLAGGPAVSADQVLLWNGTGYDIYYYQTSGLGGTGWRKSGAATLDASSTSIGAGTGFLIRRLNATPFNWVAPQHPAAF